MKLVWLNCWLLYISSKMKIFETRKLLASDCNEKFSCFRKPINCNSSDDCTYFIQFQHDSLKKHVNFAISATYDWIAIGLRKASKLVMDGNVGEVCVKNSTEPRLMSFSTKGYKAEFFSATGVTDIAAEVIDGSIICRYSRAIMAPPGTTLANLTENHYLTVSYGAMSDGRLGKHRWGHYASSQTYINFTGQVVNISGVQKPTYLLLLHACFMTFAWVFFATIGIFIARYRDYIKYNGRQIWFKLHLPFMVIALLLTVSGILTILAFKGGWKTEGAGAHPYLGILTITGALVQVVLAVFRPDPNSSTRWIFNLSHRILGILTIVCGSLSALSGCRLLSVYIGPIIAWICIFLFIMLMIEVSRRIYSIDNAVEPSNSDMPDASQQNHVNEIKFTRITNLLITALGVLVLGIAIILAFLEANVLGLHLH